ncbi:MAG: peptidase M19 [Stenotrophobium sp.]
MLTALSAALLLAGCGQSSAPAISNNGTGNGVLPPGAGPQTRYDLAQGCYALKSIPLNSYAVKDGSGAYAATAPNAAGGEAFFMKPTALGKYMFYARDQSYLVANGSSAGSATTPGEPADWTVDTADGGKNFTVFSASANKALAADPATGKLILADASSAGSAAQFGFDAATGCTDYPEAQLNTTGATFKGRGVDQPVLGFADVHNHLSATNFLGGAHYGKPFSPYGITDDLKNCSAIHGPNGLLDVIGNFEAYGTPVQEHDTVGWPTFNSWPAAQSLMHEGTYYKWVERAWMAGLRLMVSNTVENQTLCNLESKVQGHLNQNCNEMDSAASQVQFLHDMQDYIDAQEGGPGKGWFRLVTSPQQARQVINDGKLAVVTGIEISHLFNCNVTQPLGVAETDGCSKADVDAQLDRLYNLGVREMFTLHEFDNAFGGNGIFNGNILNVGNFVDTGSFWKTHDCPVEKNGYFYSPGSVMTTSDPTGVTDPITSALLGLVGVTGIGLPVYPSVAQCNSRGLTDLGRYAIQEMMKKKIVLDIDHMSLQIKGDLLDIAEQQTPVYPVISAHGGHGGISMDQAHRIIDDGGLIYPMHNNGTVWISELNKLKPLRNPKYPFAMGYGDDTNGLAIQAGPRGAGSTPISYPFTLFQGPDWGPQFNGIQPVSFDREVTGKRTFDDNAEGNAHYGLKADWVEEVRLEAISDAKKTNAAHPDQPQIDPDQEARDALGTLYNSAEGYLEMWERTLNR